MIREVKKPQNMDEARLAHSVEAEKLAIASMQFEEARQRLEFQQGATTRALAAVQSFYEQPKPDATAEELEELSEAVGNGKMSPKPVLAKPKARPKKKK